MPQVNITPSTWTLEQTDIDFLRERMNEKLKKWKVFRQHYFNPVFIQVTALGHNNIERVNAEGDAVDWTGSKAWHDELLNMDLLQKKYQLCCSDNDDHAPTSSYHGRDYDQWKTPQGELAASIVKDVDDTPSSAELSLPEITELQLSKPIMYAAGVF